MTVANIVIFLLGFFVACLLGLIVCRLVWVRAVRLTRARVERDRPETLRAFEARIAGAQARAAVSIRELERTLERERKISSQARLMADQMTSSSALAVAERDETQSSLLNLSDTLNETREKLSEAESKLAKRGADYNDLQRDLTDARQEIRMREEDIARMRHEAGEMRARITSLETGEDLPAGAFAINSAGSDIAGEQIEQMRESMRALRAERNAAEASAARARLLLDARDESEALSIARADFDAQRESMQDKIETLENQLRRAQRIAGPQLVSVDGVETASMANAATPPLTTSDPADLEQLRQSIDAMTASLTASAALDLDAHDRINALLDEAESDDTDSALVTSLVAARERLRTKTSEPGKKAPAKAARTKRTRKSTKPTGQGSAASQAKAKKESDKLAAATASGATAEKSSSMPRASENDLKVI